MLLLNYKTKFRKNYTIIFYNNQGLKKVVENP